MALLIELQCLLVSGVPDHQPHVVLFGKSKSGGSIFGFGDRDGITNIAAKLASSVRAIERIAGIVLKIRAHHV